MDCLYKTITRRARVEQTIERSRFITTITRAETREEAEAFFAAIRSEFKDATHNVPAMVIGDKMQLQWGSDDGEPQGTSGAPIVKLLVAEGLTNVALVVTRYFGGIKLGTGGLVRAYTGSAAQALKEAGISEARRMAALRISVDYSAYNKITGARFPWDVAVEDVAYTDRVALTLVADPENEEALKGFLRDLTAGSLDILGREERIAFVEA